MKKALIALVALLAVSAHAEKTIQGTVVRGIVDPVTGDSVRVINRDLSVTDTPFAFNVAQSNVAGVAVFEKFGKNPDIDTATDPEDVWNGGGLYTGQPTNSTETMEIFSSSANDTTNGTGARSVRIYNLIDGAGNAMPDVDVTLAGTAAKLISTNVYYRGASRVRVMTAGSGLANAGTITVRHTTTTTNIFCVMPVGLNSTAIAAYTVPNGKKLYIYRFNSKLARSLGADGSATTSLRVRPYEGSSVYQAIVNPAITQASGYEYDNGYFVFPARSDIVWRCDSVSDNNTIITAEISGYLVDD